MTFQTLAILGSGLSFIGYGWLSLSGAAMQEEFKRFGLEELRVFTGVLQLLGGMGLLVGLGWPLALQVSSAGISLLMLAGLIVRFRVGDGWILCLPAFAFLVINGYLFTKSLP